MGKKTYRNKKIDPTIIYNELVNVYSNKYYNLFMSSKKWKKLHKEEEDYIMRKFWADGTVSAFKILNEDKFGFSMIGFAPYAVEAFTMYDTPARVRLINERNVPFIPNKQMQVNKDVVLGYYQRNKKPVRLIVDWYVKRIANVEMVINTNVEVHKLPYLVGVTDNDISKAEDVVNKILNNELVIFADINDLNLVKVLINQAPFIIDKLYAYKTNLECELLNYLGIDSSNVDVDKAMNVDQVNANNSYINTNANSYLDELKKWCKDIKEVLGFDMDVENTQEQAQSIHQDMDHRESNMIPKNETGGTL